VINIILKVITLTLLRLYSTYSVNCRMFQRRWWQGIFHCLSVLWSKWYV